ncbi:uncharacterized protein E0L32_000970 [Thyridium curvatum]|uniref:Acireductone dioxygenase n=1 Tax=Thyridium curvatum TaxID=1093900 RepID=A0A507AMQ6_9PEZI|nr:uncharacterized protein E0L32_000970 [Thyridium curvatum]TPX11152.1 hypothetical protein E0L32_000970 [Thyridium curvatum]
MKAYLYDNLEGDQRLPHDSGKAVDVEDLQRLGVLYYRIGDIAGVDKLASERGYKNRDEITVSPDKMGDVYEAKVKSFFHEHLHEDEEIRYIRDGAGYFDVRSKGDDWIRIQLDKDDLLILPAGIYHRFTTDESNASPFRASPTRDSKQTDISVVSPVNLPVIVNPRVLGPLEPLHRPLAPPQPVLVVHRPLRRHPLLPHVLPVQAAQRELEQRLQPLARRPLRPHLERRQRERHERAAPAAERPRRRRPAVLGPVPPHPGAPRALPAVDQHLRTGPVRRGPLTVVDDLRAREARARRRRRGVLGQRRDGDLRPAADEEGVGRRARVGAAAVAVAPDAERHADVRARGGVVAAGPLREGDVLRALVFGRDGDPVADGAAVAAAGEVEGVVWEGHVDQVERGVCLSAGWDLCL